MDGGGGVVGVASGDEEQKEPGWAGVCVCVCVCVCVVGVGWGGGGRVVEGGGGRGRDGALKVETSRILSKTSF